MIKQSDFHWKKYWWIAENIELPFLARPVSVEIYTHCEYEGTEPDESRRPTERQIEIANSLFLLPPELRDEMHDVAELARAQVDEEVDLSDYDLGHINRSNIGKHYYVKSVIVPGDCEPEDTHVFFDGECRWEEEHGLRLSMVNGRFVGHSCQSGGIGVKTISRNFPA